MGVPGLTTFVEEHRHILQDVRFRNSRLVIDGCSLYFRLYFHHFLDQQHGGDYDAFARLLHRFFSQLAACDIQPFVVLDGGLDPSGRKLDSIYDRLQCRIQDADGLAQGRRKNVLPLLIKDVFVQVLYQRGVPLVQCPFEADSEIACLAHQWKCPVLTNDSDFCIFDLPGGYLPLPFFQWSHLKGRAHQQYILARSYTTARLCYCFRNMNQQLLPLCAVLNGNDYCSPSERLLELLGCSHGKGLSSANRIERLLYWLSSFSSVPEALDEVGRLMGSKGRGTGSLISHLVAGMENYHINPQCNLAHWFSGGGGAVPWEPIGGLSEALWLAVARALLPSIVVDTAVMRTVILKVQVENCRLPSVNVCNQAIRQAIYGIVLGGQAQGGAPEDVRGKRRRGRRGARGSNTEQQGNNGGSRASLWVDEYDRVDLKLTKNQVEAVPPRTHLPLDRLHQVSVAVRQGVLLEVLGVKESSLAPLPGHLKLAVAATAFWLRNATPAPSAHHLQAVLLCMVYGELSWSTQQASQGYWGAERHLLASLDRLRASPAGRQGFDIGAAHSFSQWQSCLKSTINLDKLLLVPLPEPHMQCLYSGTLVHGLHRRLKEGQAAEALLSGAPLSWQLYSALLVAARDRSSNPHPSATIKGRMRGGRRRVRGKGRGKGGEVGQGRGERGAMATGVEDISNRFALLMSSDR